MLAFSSRKKKGGSLVTTGHRGGGSTEQPLEYIDPTLSPPNAYAGTNLLNQSGLILRPVIPRQSGGASSEQPLAYLDTTLPVPSAPAGSNILEQNGLILRPVIPRQMGGDGKRGGFSTNGMSDIDDTFEKRGGFIPSVMKGVVNSGVIVAPLAAMAAHRMWNDTRKKRGGGKKEDWAQNREAAREELSAYGKPSALNINKYAALKRKNTSAADDWLTEYIIKKRTAKKSKGKKKAVVANKTVKNAIKTATMWNDLVNRAKKNLGKYGKPSGANARKFASLRKKGENTKNFLTNFKTRKQYVSPPKVKTAKNEYKRNREEAQNYLRKYGKPTIANVSKFVSLKRKGESTNAIVNAVKSRVKPVAVKSAAVKPTAKSPPPLNREKIQRNLALLHKKLLALQGKKK